MVFCWENDYSIANYSGVASNDAFVWSMTAIFMVFYFGAIFFAFKGYKEFKGMAEDRVGSQAMKKNDFTAYGAMDTSIQDNSN
eukprot:CAMPEP_0116886462 /NCGR_PEP_ID=MMETSP0463-20121206/20338_1 /TAXON_ID=181622 /ORGANISM="Strombidinopsis sp, Strain SopsisLIS2011" /LENGTH=82 /DNA_ID=CAMNT_0004546959 /DNA_START=236 /DNA_END=487 /DNA_ORIENTATION=+